MAADEFRTIRGFEEVWRPPVGGRRVRPERHPPANPGAVRARLARIVRRAPEVMVKVTGRTRSAAHLAAHLSYITRHGELPAEGRDGLVVGRREVDEAARDWAALQLSDSRRRANAPVSVAVLLSMPAGTDAIALREAARAFASEAFGEAHDYLLVLHTDTPHPHVHIAVRALGDDGRRLNPKKADLEAWRQRFAERLRDRGVSAEATPRRARGVTRKSERTPLRKIRERAERGEGPMAQVLRAAFVDAGKRAFGAPGGAHPWEERLARRQAMVRARYVAQARVLQSSADIEDRELGEAVEAFVRAMPSPDTHELELARRLRDANQLLDHEGPTRPSGRDRS